ncbi:hypothetical protein DFA_05411 [Cavenderia fasciculata]|uniref:Uncharacterized protein n=1 Tax=Cavenderia fasciculata TaxID=261658 RepID=F4PL57_CACFS|nr:uncharacterized protein DFA_05411 [Cavenderia fasciculata]EGG23279.1 hypothetical protein DFA_05411 [Cavenderia fasciculata]|eukprot:XP_004361130.1 hypothetical protein DFA_05411 [Cavenderia fasciculata]
MLYKSLLKLSIHDTAAIATAHQSNNSQQYISSSNMNNGMDQSINQTMFLHRLLSPVLGLVNSIVAAL